MTDSSADTPDESEEEVVSDTLDKRETEDEVKVGESDEEEVETDGLPLGQFKKDLPELLTDLEFINEEMKSLKSFLNDLHTKIDSGDLSPCDGGMTMLEARHHILIMYCQRLTQYIYMRTNGMDMTSEMGDNCLTQAAVLAWIGDKARGIQKQCQFSIDKMVEFARTVELEEKADEQGKDEDGDVIAGSQESTQSYRRTLKDNLSRKPMLSDLNLPSQSDDLDMIDHERRDALNQDDSVSESSGDGRSDMDDEDGGAQGSLERDEEDHHQSKKDDSVAQKGDSDGLSSSKNVKIRPSSKLVSKKAKELAELEDSLWINRASKIKESLTKSERRQLEKHRRSVRKSDVFGAISDQMTELPTMKKFHLSNNANNSADRDTAELEKYEESIMSRNHSLANKRLVSKKKRERKLQQSQGENLDRFIDTLGTQYEKSKKLADFERGGPSFYTTIGVFNKNKPTSKFAKLGVKGSTKRRKSEAWKMSQKGQKALARRKWRKSHPLKVNPSKQRNKVSSVMKKAKKYMRQKG